MAAPKKIKPPRARAVKACQHCRVRKVRCDIVHRLDICTNCSLDGVQCIEVPSKRQRGCKAVPQENLLTLITPPRPAQNRSTLSSERPVDLKTTTNGQMTTAQGSPVQVLGSRECSSHTIAGASTDINVNTNDTLDDGPLARNASQNMQASPSLCVSDTSPASASSQTARSQKSTATSRTSLAPLPDSNEDLFPDFTTSLLPNADGDDDASPSTEQHGSRDIHEEASEHVDFSRNWQNSLPAFVRPITSQRTHRYHDFLQSKGAFSMPPEKLRNSILSRYAEFVYPQLPVIDLHEALHATATNGRQGRISLLLFQSILLAGSAYVDVEYVVEAGYPSRLALRQELAERVRLLYDFDCETDRLILVQSLILMTSWQEKGDEVKHLRHWVSAAHNIALLLGLNRDPSPFPMPARRKRLWKRLWWSLYLRDRTLALGLRQTPLIARAECNLPDLDHDDFDIRSASPEVCSLFLDCGLLQDLDQQKQLAEACIAQIQLSHHLADILQARYATFAPKMGCTKLIALVLVPKTPAVDVEEVQTCSRKLDQWFRGLPDQLKCRSRLSLSFDPGQSVLMLHCSILNLFYYALVCALHRPYPSPVLRSLSAAEICFQRKSLHAADAIMSILTELQCHNLICFLPTQGITFMMQAAVTLLGDSNSPVTYLRSRSRQSLDACLQILQCIKDVHTYSYWATNLLTTAAGKLYRHYRATRKSHSGSPGHADSDAYGAAGPGASYCTNALLTSLRGIAERPDSMDDIEVPAMQDVDMSAYNDSEDQFPTADFADWVDPYVLYDNSNPMDIFQDLDWPV